MKEKTIDCIRKFTEDRDQDQFHSPANLAKSIVIEAAELLECFQWSDTEYDLQHIKEELADVLVYSQNLLDKLELDADEIVNMKMKQNEAKYPVDKAKGNATKYTELQLMRKLMCLSRCCYAKINKVMPESKNLQGLTKPEKPRKLRNARLCNNDKSTLYLPRHSSFMIMHTLADWGRVRHNMAESLGITTFQTTKAHGWKWDKGKGVGRIPQQ